MSLFMDVILMAGFGINQMWGPIMYLAILWIPNFFLEFFIYPFLPALNVPVIPWIPEDRISTE